MMSWIRSNLGPFGAIMDFFATHPEILTVILAIWMLFYAAGRIQLKLIEQRVARQVIARSRNLVAVNAQISLAEIRTDLLPTWLEEVARWNFWFIPHKYDFWPVPVTTKNVQVKLPLTTEWLAKVLKTNGIILPEPEVKASIKPL